MSRRPKTYTAELAARVSDALNEAATINWPRSVDGLDGACSIHQHIRLASEEIDVRSRERRAYAAHLLRSALSRYNVPAAVARQMSTAARILEETS